jgi:signal transduction histidine kinase
VTGFLASYLAEKGVSYAFEIEQYGLFGMTFFMGVLAYMIVKFKAFNIKLLGAQALVAGQFLLIASMFSFAETATNKILIGITLLFTTVAGWVLVKSVKAEVQRKEELKYMAERLAVSNDQLRKLDNAKTEFISIASHQLRTPLTAIKGFISLLLEGYYGKLPENQKEVLNKIYLSNDRLIDLVEDLLNVSRMESGRMEFKFDKWKIENLCQEVNQGGVTYEKGLSSKKVNTSNQAVPKGSLLKDH